MAWACSRAVGHLHEEPGGTWHGERALLFYQAMQARAGDVLHGDVMDAFELAHVVRQGHVRMDDLDRHLLLALESGPGDVPSPGPLGRQHLDGHMLLGARIEGEINGAESALPYRRQDLERAKREPERGPFQKLLGLEARQFAAADEMIGQGVGVGALRMRHAAQRIPQLGAVEKSALENALQEVIGGSGHNPSSK